MPENNLPLSSGIGQTAEIEANTAKQQLEGYQHFLDITNKMNWITAEMRETPAPPSEVTEGKPQNALKKVEFPPEGGVLTYMDGFDEPFQGFPFHELVERMDVVKKMTKGFKSGFYHYLWKYCNGWTKWPMLAITYPFFRVYSHAEIHTCWRYIERYKIKPKMYCKAVREVHRAFSVPTDEDERMKTTHLREHIRDLFCMHMEFDNAYRFRFQDVIVNLDKKEFKKDSFKEISRLFEIISSREVKQEVKDTWTLTKWMFEYLRFSKEIKLIIISFLNNLEVDKCKLDKFDYPYCSGRVDYKFNNINIKQTI